jgi:hypothetical protein
MRFPCSQKTLDFYELSSEISLLRDMALKLLKYLKGGMECPFLRQKTTKMVVLTSDIMLHLVFL